MTFAEMLLLAIVIVGGVWMLRAAFVVVCIVAACEAVADRKKP